MLKGASLAYTWSKTKGIYRFDPDFAKSLQNEGVQDDLPCDLLKELPERCIWLDCPQGGIFVCHVKKMDGDEVLEFDTRDDYDLTSFILPLKAGNVFDTLRSSPSDRRRLARSWASQNRWSRRSNTMTYWLRTYRCSFISARQTASTVTSDLHPVEKLSIDGKASGGRSKSGYIT